VNISIKTRWVWASGTYRRQERNIRGFDGGGGGGVVETRQHGRPRRRWEDNITTDLQEWEREAWTGSICLRIGTDDGRL